jgi:hypothetical protein
MLYIITDILLKVTLNTNKTVASGPAHDDQGPTIHGNGTTIQITHLIYGLVTFCLDHLI